ncbi:hypothetical protein QP405_05820 [Gleimia europaea]|uniref:hypothetical protein n=1 Tax=Gleimia europaea TaxID=66228 RepID=UPI00265B6491|nr:hypothetical protein [Gleimia europaea]MDK7143376.1 hypothetical protein [Gleimia europaea]
MRPDLFLDGRRLLDRSPKSAPLSRGASQARMTVTALLPDAGLVEVRTPDGGLLRVRASDGLYTVGVDVPVFLDESGRAVRVDPPDSLPDDAVVVAFGSTSKQALEAESQAADAASKATAAADTAGEAAGEARAALEEAKKAWQEASTARESIGAVDSSARAAAEAAKNAETAAQLTQAALDAAKEAQRLENEALKAGTDEAKQAASDANNLARGVNDSLISTSTWLSQSINETRDDMVAVQNAAAQAEQKANHVELSVLAVDSAARAAKTAAEEARAKADGLAKQAQDAMTVAQQAQTSADGKALVAYSDYQPATVSGQKIIWFKPGSVPKLFDGKTWRSVQPGDGVVSAIDINKATVGELSGMRIKAGTASVDILIPGDNARWTSSGLTIYHPLTPEQKQAGIKPTDWDKRATALNLTSDGARFISVADEAGTVTAYMSPQGEVSGRELTITGAAAVDSLKVGGLDLQEVISLNSSLAAYSVIPIVWHPAGFDSIVVVQTGWQAFPPGLYYISWNVAYQYYPSGSGSGRDAAGAFLRLQSRPEGGSAIADERFFTGNTQAPSWQDLWPTGAYSASHPSEVFEAKAGKQYRFSLGLHSYRKWKLGTWPSVFKVERLNPALELTHEVFNQSAPPAPPAPKIVTASAGLSGIWYAYGSTFAQSGSYKSGGRFHIPGAKGKKILNIYVSGRCNFDFVDGGAGKWFSFHLGGENKSAFVRDYGAVDLTFGATAGGFLSRNGYLDFQANPGAPAYNEYNPGSFRCTVTYQ